MALLWELIVAAPTVELSNRAVIRGIVSGRLMKHRIKVVAGERCWSK
jgi:translation initiation factor IF-1